MNDLRVKDYVRVDGELYFAVVSDVIEQRRALTWLRYIRKDGQMIKLDTLAARDYITRYRPQFLFHSEVADIELHGIPLTDIERSYKPRDCAACLLEYRQPDNKQQDAIYFIQLLVNMGIKKDCLGVTGSLLLNAQRDTSDIDVVVYGRENFFAARDAIAAGIKQDRLQALQERDWRESYARRHCSIGFNEYCLHESRKLNKCIVGNTKVDITMVPDREEQIVETGSYKKSGRQTLHARVVDDRYAYDSPARFYIDHETVSEVLVFTATYTGQAVSGEVVEASGVLELGPADQQRLVIGTSREAQGEYLKVVESNEL